MTFFVPLFAIVFHTLPWIGSLILSILIFGSMLMIYNQAFRGKFTIGIFSESNYYFLNDILTKPWTHLHNISLGIFLAKFYRMVIDYRSLSAESRSEKYPILHRFYSKSIYSYSLILISSSMIFGTIVYQWPFNINPRLSSEVHNSLFCAFSRIIIPTGVMIFIMVIFLN